MAQSRDDSHSWNVRTLLESRGTPFTIVRYEERGLLYSQGDACDSLLHIESGLVRLSVSTSAGKEAICGLLSAGAFLGDEALAGYAARRLTATAVTAVEVLVVEKGQMIRLLRTRPQISHLFIAHILARNTRLESDLTDQLLNSCEQRLARTLLVLAGCDEHHPLRRPLPAVSQAILAEIVGTTRSRVNSFMGKFRKLGFIEEGGDGTFVTPSLFSVVNQDRRAIAEHRRPFRAGR